MAQGREGNRFVRRRSIRVTRGVHFTDEDSMVHNEDTVSLDLAHATNNATDVESTAVD